MTARQALWFIVAYAALVAASVWLNVSGLCLAAAKYDNGCGGLGTYLSLWEIFLLPLLIAAIAIERWRRTAAPPAMRLVIYLVVIGAVFQIGWRLEKFPVLLALEAVVIALFAFARWRRISQPVGP
jgi:hypothetical protein